MTKSNANMYQTITDKIIAQLESGIRAWHKPWSMSRGVAPVAGMPIRHNGQPYQGINVVLLWGAAAEAGYSANTWMTYKQAKDLGAFVRAGEKSATIVYANTFAKEVQDKNGETVFQKIPFLKTYAVFNVGQIENLPAHYYGTVELPPLPARIDAAESFFLNVGARVKESRSNQAYYSPALDQIAMPLFAQFESPESFYSVLGHEHVHWTGHEKRCARKFGAVKGDEDYAFEELVAEIGAAFLCAHLGLTDEPRRDHADYIASWLKVLRGNNRAIFKAAAAAQKAVNFMIGQQPGITIADDEDVQEKAA